MACSPTRRYVRAAQPSLSTLPQGAPLNNTHACNRPPSVAAPSGHRAAGGRRRHCDGAVLPPFLAHLTTGVRAATGRRGAGTHTHRHTHRRTRKTRDHRLLAWSRYPGVIRAALVCCAAARAGGRATNTHGAEHRSLQGQWRRRCRESIHRSHALRWGLAAVFYAAQAQQGRSSQVPPKTQTRSPRRLAWESGEAAMRPPQSAAPQSKQEGAPPPAQEGAPGGAGGCAVGDQLPLPAPGQNRRLQTPCTPCE